jgi:hypothetical protein
MSFVDPSVWRRTLEGLRDYCVRHKIPSIASLSGALIADVKAVPRGW